MIPPHSSPYSPSSRPQSDGSRSRSGRDLSWLKTSVVCVPFTKGISKGIRFIQRTWLSNSASPSATAERWISPVSSSTEGSYHTPAQPPPSSSLSFASEYYSYKFNTPSPAPPPTLFSRFPGDNAVRRKLDSLAPDPRDPNYPNSWQAADGHHYGRDPRNPTYHSSFSSNLSSAASFVSSGSLDYSSGSSDSGHSQYPNECCVLVGNPADQRKKASLQPHPSVFHLSDPYYANIGKISYPVGRSWTLNLSSRPPSSLSQSSTGSTGGWPVHN